MAIWTVTGLQTVQVGVGKGMLLVEHFIPQILIAVDYCGRQLA